MIFFVSQLNRLGFFLRNFNFFMRILIKSQVRNSTNYNLRMACDSSSELDDCVSQRDK